MKRIFAVVLMLLMAGCNLSSDPLLNYDWCYRFDYRISSFGVTPARGNWIEGRGFIPDFDGYLEITYTAPQSVSANGLIFQMSRAISSFDAINLTIAADIFGTTLNETTVQLQSAAQTYTIRKAVGGSQGDTFSLTAHSSHPIQLEIFRVQGKGENPIGEDNCDTPSGSPIDIPAGDIIEQIKDADDELQDSTIDITAPGGTALIPSTVQNLETLFGYAKWLVSPTAANSLAGPFAPFVIEAGVLIGSEMLFLGAYLVVYIFTYLARWAIWIFRLIVTIITALSGLVGGAVGFLLRFVRP